MGDLAQAGMVIAYLYAHFAAFPETDLLPPVPFGTQMIFDNEGARVPANKNGGQLPPVLISI